MAWINWSFDNSVASEVVPINANNTNTIVDITEQIVQLKNYIMRVPVAKVQPHYSFPIRIVFEKDGKCTAMTGKSVDTSGTNKATTSIDDFVMAEVIESIESSSMSNTESIDDICFDAEVLECNAVTSSPDDYYVPRLSHNKRTKIAAIELSSSQSLSDSNDEYNPKQVRDRSNLYIKYKCKHNHRVSTCKICTPCNHGLSLNTCHVCSFQYCSHQRKSYKCSECIVKLCIHASPFANCNVCRRAQWRARNKGAVKGRCVIKKKRK